ncbi:MAG: division/cell wall cluster transcriptional repressor MraZ [Burkholderiales bacterium]|nr:division/cell wall cluster transcriptional repressor MraZ [Burkholderiales bacterium]MDE2394827.1 division/cell wall cluster transcriptional repressor MraZ [Burkholderiales bacterium]MDE2454436.1 division/cell wall cluster transcriptional repressor MraZ [Burkholderiales bacterium]
MAIFAFRGGPVLTLDAKGRITVPSRYRDVLMSTVNGEMVVSKNPARCLTLYPRPVWEAFEAELAQLSMKHDGWRRLYIGSATDVEIDSASRVLVPQELREWAGLERDVVFMGVGDKFELWDKARYEAGESLVIAGGLPDELQNKVAG